MYRGVLFVPSLVASIKVLVALVSKSCAFHKSYRESCCVHCIHSQSIMQRLAVL